MVLCPARLIAWFEGKWTNLLVKESFDYYPVGESVKIYRPSKNTSYFYLHKAKMNKSYKKSHRKKVNNLN